MVAGGARWPGLGWRGGEVGMEWWHYLETESFYRNISGSSVTRPHCAHRTTSWDTPPPCTLTWEPGTRSQEAGVHFISGGRLRGGKECKNIFVSSNIFPVLFKR